MKVPNSRHSQQPVPQNIADVLDAYLLSKEGIVQIETYIQMRQSADIAVRVFVALNVVAASDVNSVHVYQAYDNLIGSKNSPKDSTTRWSQSRDKHSDLETLKTTDLE